MAGPCDMSGAQFTKHLNMLNLDLILTFSQGKLKSILTFLMKIRESYDKTYDPQLKVGENYS